MDEVNAYHCNCAPGYEGNNCETGEYLEVYNSILSK